jgi:predicted nuclease with TOPRIM domain
MTTTPKSTSRTRQSDEGIAAGSEPSAIMTKDEVLATLEGSIRFAESQGRMTEMRLLSETRTTIEALFDENTYRGVLLAAGRETILSLQSELAALRIENDALRSESLALRSRLERAEGRAIGSESRKFEKTAELVDAVQDVLASADVYIPTGELERLRAAVRAFGVAPCQPLETNDDNE